MLSASPILVFRAAAHPQPPSRRRTRTPALVRPDAADLAPLRLTPRDLGILRAVYNYRALTARQIHALFFSPSPGTRQQTVSSRCQYRLKRLFQHGYLQRDAPPARQGEGRKPLVYFLDRAAKAVLASTLRQPEAAIRWRSSHNRVGWPFLEHLLATNDVRVAIQLACRRHGVTLQRWVDEHRLRSQEMKDYVSLPERRGRVAVVPDGYCQLRDRHYAYHHFLEVDRATETVGLAATTDNAKTFARKIQAYLAYYRSGHYARRYGTQAMRVLVVTTSEQRLANLRAVTARVGGGRQFWFVTLDRLQPETVLQAPIWQMAGVPGEYALLWPQAAAQQAARDAEAMQPSLLPPDRAGPARRAAMIPSPGVGRPPAGPGETEMPERGRP